MHLSGETDAGDCVSSDSAVAEGPLHGQAAGSPPILWILLCPAGARRGKVRVLLASGRNNFSVLVNDQSASPAGPDIDPKE